MTAKSVINRMIASGTLTREDPSDDNGAPLVSDASSVASFRRRVSAVSRVTGRPEDEVMSAYAARDNGDSSTSDALEFMYYTR